MCRVRTALDTCQEAAMHDPEACLFFARAPQDVITEELTALFSQYGTIEDVSIYRSWPAAKTSKGCGTVQFADKASASAAMQALSGSSSLPRAEGALVVERMDPNKQKNKVFGPKKLSGSKSSTRDTHSANDQAPATKQKPGSTSAAAAPGSAAALASYTRSEQHSSAWGSHANMASPADVDEAAMLAMLSIELQTLGVTPPGAATSRNISSTSNASSSMRSGSTGYAAPTSHLRQTWCGGAQADAVTPGTIASGRAWAAGTPPGSAFQGSWQQQQQQQQRRQGRQPGACHRSRRSSAPICGRPAVGGFHTPITGWRADPRAAAAAGRASLDAAAAVAGAAADAVQVRRPAPLQGSSSFSNWGSFTSPQLLQQLKQTHGGVGPHCFQTPPAAATVGGMPAAFRSLEPALTSYSSSSLYNSYSNSVTPAAAPACNDFALFGSPAMSQAMLSAAFDAPTAATAAAAVAGPMFSASTGSQLSSIGSAGAVMSSATGSAGLIDHSGQGDVLLMHWLMLQQQLHQHEAAGIAAAAAAAAAPVEQLPLSNTQAQQQRQQQLLLTVELEPQAWASIAENRGWQDVARLSGAQIEVQVQASSHLLALQVSGTAAQVDMVSKLMCLLLQQPAMAARGVTLRD